MSRGMTIADFVQQVFYAIYKVRLDVTADPAVAQAFHADTDKFKEIVMEGNFVLQELQKEADWNWLRERIGLGTTAVYDDGSILEIELDDNIVYKLCTGFNDAVRLHDPNNPNIFIEVPFVPPRSGTTNTIAMHDEMGRLNVHDDRLRAFVVGNILTFNRPFYTHEAGATIEADYIRLLDPLHICDSDCTQPDPLVYEELVFTEIPDPYYMVVRTAAKRAEGDPSVADRVMSLTDEAAKLLSAMRENDSSKTFPDTYSTSEIGFTRVL